MFVALSAIQLLSHAGSQFLAGYWCATEVVGFVPCYSQERLWYNQSSPLSTS